MSMGRRFTENNQLFNVAASSNAKALEKFTK